MSEASAGDNGKDTPLIRPRILPQRPPIYRRLWTRFVAFLLAIYRFIARFITTLLMIDPGSSGNASDYRRPPQPPGGGNGRLRPGASDSFYAPAPTCILYFFYDHYWQARLVDRRSEDKQRPSPIRRERGGLSLDSINISSKPADANGTGPLKPTLLVISRVAKACCY